MADKIVVMNGGNVEQIGAPLELYDRPTNLFVAGFIGSPAMNFLKGKIEGGSFRAEGGDALPLPAGRNGSDGRPTVYGVRPEHFQLDPQRRCPPRCTWSSRPARRRRCWREFAGASVLCAFRERVSAKPGETIRITPDPSLVHLFDAGTGQRLAG